MIPATMPIGGRLVPAWIMDGIALLAPWIWLVALDRLLRRTS